MTENRSTKRTGPGIRLDAGNPSFFLSDITEHIHNLAHEYVVDGFAAGVEGVSDLLRHFLADHFVGVDFPAHKGEGGFLKAHGPVQGLGGQGDVD